MKAPAIQLYTGDWMKDPALRACGPLARGVWIDCLCLMHESEEKGVLRFNGKPVTNDQIARMIGATPAEVRKAINELEAAGVFSRHEDGAIFSRRMVRDAKFAEQRREWGKLGGEHGNKGGSHGSKGGRPPKDKNPPSDSNKGGFLTPSEPPPSSSSSSSSSSSEEEPPNPLWGSGEHQLFAKFWQAFPRKSFRVAAARAFAELNPSPELLRRILDAIERQKRWPDWTDQGGKFIPHPENWIRKRGWENQQPEALKPAGPAMSTVIYDTV